MHPRGFRSRLDSGRSQCHGIPVRTLEIGLVLPMGDTFVDGSTARWAEIRNHSLRAEEIGFDIVWTADELLWRPAETVYSRSVEDHQRPRRAFLDGMVKT